MKKTIAIFIALFSLVAMPVQAAEVQKTLVIIDDGYDPSLTEYTKNIIAERCVSSMVLSCPNNMTIMDGKGSAALTPAQLAFKTATHGTEMLASAVSSNPSIKVVFVRMASFTKTGFVYGTDTDLANVLNWVYANRTNLNIGAVAYSISRVYSGTCPTHAGITNATNNLIAVGIPFIAAAGNNYDITKVNFPACIPSVIAIGAVDNNVHTLYSNAGTGLDFDAQGQLDVSWAGTVKRINGTSPAAQVFAASWINLASVKTLGYNDLYSLIAKTATSVTNSKGVKALAINLDKALV